MVSSNCTDDAVVCNSQVTEQIVFGLQLPMIVLQDCEQFQSARTKPAKTARKRMSEGYPTIGVGGSASG